MHAHSAALCTNNADRLAGILCRSMAKGKLTPFGKAAYEARRYSLVGGKPDDITVVVAYVRDSAESKL